MDCVRSIIEKLSSLDESFIVNGYKYWKYNGEFKRCQVSYEGDLGESDPISEEEYNYARNLNKQKDSNNDLWKDKDLDDETKQDIMRFSRLYNYIEDNKDSIDNEYNEVKGNSDRYLAFIKLFINQMYEDNLPFEKVHVKTSSRGKKKNRYDPQADANSSMQYILDKFGKEASPEHVIMQDFPMPKNYINKFKNKP